MLAFLWGCWCKFQLRDKKSLNELVENDMSLGAGIIQFVSAAGLDHPGLCCFPALGHTCQGAGLGSEHTAILEKESLWALMGLGAPSSSLPIKSTKKTEGVPGTQRYISAPDSLSPK